MPEFGVIDTLLEEYPEIVKIAQPDIAAGTSESGLGRQDTPSVEQILRAGIYKELRGMDYRGLAQAQYDSRMFEYFVKVEWEKKAYSFQVYQKYISRIKVETLEKIMVKLNKIAIENGIEDLKRFCEDSTVTETDIHYPTNNSLVWDCIKTAQNLLKELQEEVKGLEIKDYKQEAKKTYFKINVTKGADKRVELFEKQLKTFTLAIEQTTKVVKKKSELGANLAAALICVELEQLLPLMDKVYKMTEKKEIQGEKVPVDEKLFSIYELHTDLIVKGSRDVKFGHKINLGTGGSNLILACEIVKGNPCDSTLFKTVLKDYKKDYGCYPESVATDGGYATLKNLKWAKKREGIKNIVFNKVVGSLKSIAVSVDMETKLKKWRSAIEAVISNLKRGFHLRRCAWKGLEHFKQKVYWSIIGYNIRVMTAAFATQIANL
jgi:IS5 family transposase